MIDSSIEKIIIAIEKGKVRGFNEIKEINGENYFFQYALKKKDGKYSTYFFSIPEKKINFIEDYATEDIIEFSTIADAFNYFEVQKINVEIFSSIKGILPF